MKILLDTNIILDIFLTREPNIKTSEKIFELILQDKINGYLTANSVTDIYYITAKRLGNEAARKALRNLFDLVEIINVDGNDCFIALDLPVTDYEDALVVACAKKTKIDYIITNDNNFLCAGYDSTNIISPFDFLHNFS